LSIEVPQLLRAVLEMDEGIDAKTPVVSQPAAGQPYRSASLSGGVVENEWRKAEKRQTTPKEKLDSSRENEYDVAVRQVV
jgi:hypothetical protein